MKQNILLLIGTLLFGICFGFAFSRGKDLIESSRAALQFGNLPPAEATRSKTILPYMRVRELNIVDPTKPGAWIQLGINGEGGPGLWINKSNRQYAFTGGVHGNGTPMWIVTDTAVRNFGLGRSDGKNLTPILVYRSDDEVKMVFGLDMQKPGKEPFLVYYTGDGKKHLLLGDYCDNPSRACI